MNASSMRIATRFRGPDESGNGGYTAGLLAAHLPEASAVEVRLRRPPPLDTDLSVTVDADGAQITLDSTVVAQATPATLDVAAVEPVSAERARAADADYGGWSAHPFPGCFSCGTTRHPPDGLGLRPGRLGDGRTACAWTPAAELTDGPDTPVPAPIVWAALDCPGGWTSELEARPLVLGTITARIDALPWPGDPCVIMGKLLGQDGRKTSTATTLYAADERVLARAHHIWIAI